MSGYTELYRKNVDGEFEPVNLFFSEHPKPGIWMVKKIDKGTRWTWLNERLEDLPKSMTKATLEPYRDEILQRWIAKGEDMMIEVTPYDLATILFDVISEGMHE